MRTVITMRWPCSTVRTRDLRDAELRAAVVRERESAGSVFSLSAVGFHFLSHYFFFLFCVHGVNAHGNAVACVRCAVRVLECAPSELPRRYITRQLGGAPDPAGRPEFFLTLGSALYSGVE